jgi:two-component system, cell cycle response regulator
MSDPSLSVTVNGTVRAAFNVLPLGLPPTEISVLGRMFMLAAVRPLSYRLITEEYSKDAHIYFVDGHNADALRQWRELSQVNERSTVFVSEVEIDSNSPSVRRPMLLPRVLGALDIVAKRNADRMLQTSSPGSNGNATNANVKPIRVLVVDDSQPVRAFMGGVLSTYQITPEFCESGEEALLALLNKDFEVIFLDVVMGGIDGYEVCKQIKNRRGKGKCRVVMLTSKDRAFDKIKGALAGCDAYLTKPVDEPKLHALIKKYVSELSAAGQPMV